MIVKCIIVPNGKKFPVLDEIYDVFGIDFLYKESEEKIQVSVFSDQHDSPVLIELKYFEIINDNIPPDWVFRKSNFTNAFFLEPKEFIGDFWDNYHDDNPDSIKIFQEVEKKIKLFHDDELELYEKNSVNLANNKFSLSQLSNIIQWSGLKTVEEIVSVILPICDSNQEYLEYKKLFENLKQSANDENLKDTLLPNELVSKILDNLGMVVFYRKNSNILSSLSYEQEGSKLRLCNEWSAYIREHGFESVIDYNYEDETIMRTSDALMKYGYEKIEKVYERTRVEL
jgi:hypothetical protein